MRACVLIYFLSFAQIEKKERTKQAEERLSRGSAEAFIFYWMIIVIVPLSVQDSPLPTFLL